MSYITLLIFGMLSACFALLFEIGILSFSHLTDPSLTPLNFASLFTLLLAAAIEEISKFAFLKQYVKRYLPGGSAERTKFLFLGIFFGIGFALPEIALTSQFFSFPLFPPILGILALHLMTSILLAFFVLRRKDSSVHSMLFPLGLVIVIHLVYNLVISYLF